jgi:hypothetical protein
VIKWRKYTASPFKGLWLVFQHKGKQYELPFNGAFYAGNAMVSGSDGVKGVVDLRSMLRYIKRQRIVDVQAAIEKRQAWERLGLGMGLKYHKVRDIPTQYPEAKDIEVMSPHILETSNAAGK